MNYRIWSLWACLLCGVAGSAMTDRACAQETNGSDSGQVETIVVTAEKRAESVQTVPAEIGVVSSEELQRNDATQLSDYAALVPGLNVASGGAPGLNTIVLGGVPPLGTASEVGIYVNDTPVGSSSTLNSASEFTINMMPYDLQRIEVLEGPQGTLYGASTMGGLLRYVLAEPDLDNFYGKAGADIFSVSNAGSPGYGVRAMVNAPLVNGELGLRVSGYEETTPGYIDSYFTGAKDQNSVRQYGAHVSLLWKPTSDLSVELSWMNQTVDAKGIDQVALNPATGRPVYGNYVDFNYVTQPYHQELDVFNATVNWDVKWATLTSSSSYERDTNNQYLDETYNLVGYINCCLYGGAGDEDATTAKFHYQLGLDKFTQELRLTSPSNQSFEWMLGLFYTNERASDQQSYLGYNASGQLITSGYNPIAMQTVPVSLLYASLPSLYQEYAIFADGTYHITDNFDIGAGVRYSHNNQAFQEFLNEGLYFDDSTAINAFPRTTSAEGVTTFMVSPRYHIDENSIVYARIASGYQPGAPNISLPNTDIPSLVQSSRLVDYQIGWKQTLLGNRATIDASVFHIVWSDIQVYETASNNTRYVGNAGAASSDGAEFAGTYSPLDGLTLGANVAYTDAVTTQSIASLTAHGAGARLPYVPLFSGSGTVEYDFPLTATWNGFFGGVYHFQGKEYSEVQGEAGSLPTPSYNTVSLHLGAQDDRWRVMLYVKNLTNALAYQPPSYLENGALGVTPLQPRTIGATFDASF